MRFRIWFDVVDEGFLWLIQMIPKSLRMGLLWLHYQPSKKRVVDFLCETYRTLPRHKLLTVWLEYHASCGSTGGSVQKRANGKVCGRASRKPRSRFSIL